MGFHGISLSSLLLILIIAVIVFGTKRLRNMGEDLGAAIRGFQKGLKGEDTAENFTSEKSSTTTLKSDEK